MTYALVAVLAAGLAFWLTAFLLDARHGRYADPIGEIWTRWLAFPSLAAAATRRPVVHPDPALEAGRPGDHLVTDLKDTLFSRPLVYATEPDLAQLRGFVRSAPRGGPGLDLLLEELGRMSLAAEGVADSLVRLGSWVTYRDLKTRRQRTVRVVAPKDADLEENRVSVLSPIGAALIGLSPGAIFRWNGPDGSARAIKVLALEHG